MQPSATVIAILTLFSHSLRSFLSRLVLQSGGVEVGSSVSTLPTNDQIIAWGRSVLGMM
jgi:hypothetical protein